LFVFFSPSFDFYIGSIIQAIGWEEHPQNYSFTVEWGIKT